MTRKEVYRALSEMYGWTPNQIAQMTLAQQMIYLSDPVSDKRIVTFDTMDEARRFIRRVKGGL